MRPSSVPKTVYNSNWDAIFGKKAVDQDSTEKKIVQKKKILTDLKISSILSIYS